jgi:PAS domain S-box-containing protein
MLKKKTPPPQKSPETPAERAAGTDSTFRLFFECSPVAMVIIEEGGLISHTNQKFSELSGFPLMEIEGKKHWKEFVDPQDYERLASFHREILKPGGWIPPASSFGFIVRGNIVFPGLLSVKRIHGTTQVIATVSDHSIQKRLENLLRSNEERYRTMVNNLNVGLFKTRPEHPGKCLWANPALFHMYGCDSLADFAQKPIHSYYADPRERERFINELREKGQVKNFETLHKRKDGSPFWVRLTAFPKKRADGSIEWIEGSTEDINTDRVAITSCEAGKEFLNEMVDSALGIGLICTNPEGTITLFNKGAEQLLGYTAEEIVGKQTSLGFHLEPELTSRSHILSAEAGRLITGFEILTSPLMTSASDERQWSFRKKDGGVIVVHITIAKIRTRDNIDRGYLITAKEITEQKRLEEAFRSSALQMSGVINNLPDAMFAIDREGKVIAWNRAIEIITGVRAVDILGKGNYEYALPFYGSRRPMLIDLISEPDSRIEEWGFTNISRKGNAVTAETPALDQNNKLKVLWTIAAPIFDAAGDRAGAIVSLADVTERRRKEAALKDTVERFREILDNTGSATAIIEEDDTISYVNPEFGRVLGYVREEVEGKKKWMEFVAPEDVPRMQEYRKKRKTDPANVPSRYEFRFIRWDGEVRNGFLTITRIPDTKKIVVALFDITDKTLAEEAVQRANKKLNFFNSITRHDILNQLTVLKGNLELTREVEKDPARHAVLGKELAATNAIQSLIMFTRDYQDIGISPPEWQDLHKIILNSCTGIHLESISLSLEVVGVEVYADRLLEKVFFHLISNAITHGEKVTGIRISCRESFEELHIICEDDGIGVPPEAKEKIFNREYFKRTGLDMYLAREILSITDISIRETGTYGDGARFEMHVPKGGYRFTVTP